MAIADLLIEAQNCAIQQIPIPEYPERAYNIQNESYEDIHRAVHQLRLLCLTPTSPANISLAYLEALSQIPSYVQQRVYSFVHAKDWANAARWMCLYHLSYPDELHKLAKQYPKELGQAVRTAYASDLCSYLLQLSCSIQDGNQWTMEAEFLRAHFRACPLKDTDLGHIEEGWGTPWNVWDRYVQPLLDAAPFTEGYELLNAYGQQLKWATPLPNEHLHVLHMSLHPRAQLQSRLGESGPDILEKIIQHTQRL